MSNYNEMPELIFDLIKTKPFGELTAEEHRLAGLYFTEKEYDELHTAYCASSVFAHDEMLKQARRSEMLHAFDRFHNRAATRSLKIAWSAAAVLFIALLGSVVRQSLIGPEYNTRVVSVVDTVFVGQYGPAQIVHDTILAQSANSTEIAGRSDRTQPGSLTRVADPGDMNVMPVSEVASDANRMKGYSVFYDSLCRNYEFVEM